MRHGKAAAALVICAAVTAGVYAQQKASKGTLTAQDYAEINQLYIQYNYGIDTHAEGGLMWARTFTPDGIFDLGAAKFQGTEKLAEFAKLKPGAPPPDAPHHFATNIKIDPSPEGATGSAYFFNVTTPEKDKGSSITATGTYQDLLVKTSDGWRFKKRTFYANALPPAMVGQVSAR